MANSPKAKAVGTLHAEAAGRAVAVRMLEEIERNGLDDAELWPWSICAMYRPVNAQQDNIVLSHIKSIQHDRKMLSGFCSVLTDFFGITAHVGSPNLDYYKKLSKRDITGKPGLWPRMDDDAIAADAERAEEKEWGDKQHEAMMEWVKGRLSAPGAIKAAGTDAEFERFMQAALLKQQGGAGEQAKG